MVDAFLEVGNAGAFEILHHQAAIEEVFRRVERFGDHARGVVAWGNLQLPAGEERGRLEDFRHEVGVGDNPVPAVCRRPEDAGCLGLEGEEAVMDIRCEARVVEVIEVDNTVGRDVVWGCDG